MPELEVIQDSTDDQMRDLGPSEWGNIMAMYDAPTGRAETLEEAGHQRNVKRHARRLGLLIVSALSAGGGVDPHSLFSLAVRGAEWTHEDVEEFLGRDSDQENRDARLIHRDQLYY